MKAKKLLAFLCCATLALSVLAGCGKGTDEPKTDGTKDQTETEAKGDPADPAGYYQFSYDVEGLGLWVNYLH